ncbi:anoctamin-like protein At1g73020 isoform X2 [Eucalyptus grandis]|uniref:anoctamin-like protein At1g73020 isoform X2 n=1 Tax=Eucalyptus grandis TaxID=71139 RepID=UPI00192F0B55|nr:anoctamin-like protein At1g73020 isoform X2 [Eucalyptus grandis]
MVGHGEEEPVYEIAVAVPKRTAKEGDESEDCVEVLVEEFRKVGLITERVVGIADEFIKLAAPLDIFGRTAAELHMKKPTHIGMDLQFEWEDVHAFVRQPDGSLFSWCERFHFYRHLIYGIVNKSRSDIILKWDAKEIHWEPGEPLLQRLESESIVKQVFPIHVEAKRKELLRSWALNWLNFTRQPIDDIYLYFGTKIAVYFAFLGMYTRWMMFPAGLGLISQLIDFGWQISYSVGADPGYDLGYKLSGKEWSSIQSPVEIAHKEEQDRRKDKEKFQREEWFGAFLRIRNDAIVILSIICLQLPFELAYAHLYEVVESDVIKFGLTAIYLVLIQHFTRIGGKVSVQLINHERNVSREYRADSLVYKVFGLYFMQSYIGLFYHALLHRNFMTLRQVLIQRLIISEVLENLWENSFPYLKYSYKKHKVRKKKRCEKGSTRGRIQFASRVEKEYLKPSYSASIGDELEDGLFDDFLELALQFGMIMMFACAFPLAFAFAALNNITEIRTDALKLLVMMKRPVPRAAVTIGAWLNIFQFLIVMSICTNSALLVCLYDQEGKWKIEPGLAAILVMEHVLLLIKFGVSRFVPEEPAWVRAHRVKNATQAQDVCSKQLLRTISAGEKLFLEATKED